MDSDRSISQNGTEDINLLDVIKSTKATRAVKMDQNISKYPKLKLNLKRKMSPKFIQVQDLRRLLMTLTNEKLSLV